MPNYPKILGENGTFSRVTTTAIGSPHAPPPQTINRSAFAFLALRPSYIVKVIARLVLERWKSPVVPFNALSVSRYTKTCVVERKKKKEEKMRFLAFLSAAALAPLTGHAAPARDLTTYDDFLAKRENLCSLNAPPEICQPDDTVTVEETAQRAYDFYRSFVVDGDPRKMFSLIDKDYIVGFRPA